MQSYLDILEACLSENVEGTSGDVVGKVAKALQIDRKEAEERMGELSLVIAAEITDAAIQNDLAAIVLKMGGKPKPLAEQAPLAHLPKGDVIPPNADYENWDGTIIDGGPQPGNPPLHFDPNAVDANGRPVDLRTRQLAQQAARGNAPVTPTTAKPGQVQPNQQVTQTNRPATKPTGTITRSTGTQPPLAEDFSAGDEVIVDDNGNKKEGVVSGVHDGPANSNTVGVLLKGDLQMFNKEKVEMAKDDKKIDEHVLGFSNIGIVPGMRQMMELAMFTAKKDEDEIDAKIEAAEKDDSDEDATEETKAAEPKPEVKKEATQPAQAPAATSELLVFDISSGTQSNVAQPAEPAAAKTAVGATTEPQEAEDPREQILKALDVIERNMPDLRMADFRDVRARLDKVSNVVLERAMNRRPKL